MHRRLTGLLLACLCPAHAALRELPAPSKVKTELTTLANVAGGPVLAWTEVGINRQVRAAQWDGQTWQALGGVINEDPTFNAAQLSSRTDRTGRVWLGWAEDAGIAHVDSWLMSVWDGQTWVRPTGAVRRNLSDAGRSRSFDVLPSGIPALAWTDIHVQGAWGASVRSLRWNGQTWLQGTVLNELKYAGFAPDLRVGQSGRQTVAFLEGDYARMNVVVAQQGASGNWRRLGQPLNRHPDTFTATPKLALSPWGAAIVAWIEADPQGPDRLYVSRQTGQAWQALGSTVSTGAGAAEQPALALTPSSVRVAWLENGVLHAAEWRGGDWRALGLPRTQHATGPSLSPDGQFLAVSDGGKLRVWAWE